VCVQLHTYTNSYEFSGLPGLAHSVTKRESFQRYLGQIPIGCLFSLVLFQITRKLVKKAGGKDIGQFWLDLFKNKLARKCTLLDFVFWLVAELKNLKLSVGF